MLINADARALPLRDGSVQCVVTSPPYWGLRDYGTSRWEGGSEACDHRESSPDRTAAAIAASGLDGGKASVHRSHVYRAVCARCGATRIDAQIGLEPTPTAYVDSIVAACREVRRVLRDDGTLWLNLGDSYSNSASMFSPHAGQRADRDQSAMGFDRSGLKSDVKPKDLVGIPWRVALALQADGWWLRCDIVWAKRNVMPESVQDRPTRAHEYVFLLAKSARYYYNAAAIREPARAASITRYEYTGPDGRINTRGAYAEASAGANGSGMNHGRTRNPIPPDDGKANARSVWSIASEPYRGAHYATFPTALAKRCILAGSHSRDVVLDPFVGSGTTVRVARDLGRVGVGVDLSLAYLLDHARARTSTTMGLAF